MKSRTISNNYLPALLILMLTASPASPATAANTLTKLPPSQLKGTVSLEETLQARRSVRKYADTPLTLAEISQLLWSAQGITHHRGLRTAPSAGALYPLKLTLVAGNVSELTPGIYRYLPKDHALEKISRDDVRNELAAAALDQPWVREAAAVIVISAHYQRTTKKYHDRGIRYVHIEAGHAGQNLFLQAVSLGLGTVVVGAFNDAVVGEILQMNENEQPLILMPVGHRH